MANRLKRLTWLDLRLAIRSIGWATSISLLLSLSGVFLEAGIKPALNKHIVSFTDQIIADQVKAEASSAAPETGYSAFQSRLFESNDREGAIKRLFAEAKKANVSLSQGDYQLQSDAAGKFGRYQIALPVKGSYSSIRNFVDGTLAELPGLSVDEISFRRENIKSGSVEANLKLTLYLKESGQR